MKLTFLQEGVIIKMGLERAFAIIGLIVTISLIFILLFNVVCFIGLLIRELHKKHKTKRELKHRFGKPPVSKCYCLNCRNAEYFGDDRCGKCRLIGDNVTIKDNGFCWNADPKK